MDKYKLTVGLEIHAELKTRTKMFCDSKNDPDETKPNTNICPVCMGYPGTLPVINFEAVKSVLKLGLAVGGELADYTEFDRKNYFYPDIPKGYQISQYKHPLVKGGSINGVALTRLHLEEDTARSNHESGSKNQEASLVDFNRAGVPLVELVTEPVIGDAETAAKFAKEFQLILNYLGIAEANMEKGEMRIEANISVAKVGDLKVGPLGTKVEVKNLNSFKVVEKAIKHEYERQVALLEKGESVVQETRGWDDSRGVTYSQRVKESSHDYRYFPDPDLPKLLISEISEFSLDKLRTEILELPEGRRARYKSTYGLKDADIEIYVSEVDKGRYFEDVISKLSVASAQLASNYITSDMKKVIPVENFAEIIKMIEAGELSSRGAKDILKIIEQDGGEPRMIAKEKDLIQESRTEVLEKIAEEVISENRGAPVQFLVGQVMKKTNNKANPVVLKEIFNKLTTNS